MTQGSNDERAQKYAEAIHDLTVDHAMWIGDDGKPLDYLPERETRIADFVYQTADAVMAVADAERAELRADSDYHRDMGRAFARRAGVAEAKVAGVGKLIAATFAAGPDCGANVPSLLHDLRATLQGSSSE